MLLEVALPAGLEPTTLARLRTPVAIALGVSALGALLALLAAVDLARLVVGADAVAVVLALALLLLPASKLMLGAPSGPMGAIVRAASLLRAIDLGHALGDAWRLAALLAPIGPAVVGGFACSAVLVARGALLPGVAVATAAASGAVVAWLAVDRTARMLVAGATVRVAPSRLLAQVALAVAAALGAAAVAPLLAQETRAVLGPAAMAAALATAVHLAAELLALDARGPLRLAQSLVGCGADPRRIVGVALAGAGGCAALLGAVAALAVAALSAAPLLAALAGLGTACIVGSALAVLVTRPRAADVVPRVLLMGAALVPVGLALAVGSWVALAVALAVVLSLSGWITMGRLR
ncbi:hypothetical protein [Agrococcus sp. ProA11]|uniref:hypothetical protein n=1 Tax=Agrococcus chionoecetis TaxID=3153752 RepID=UPI003261C007